MCLKVGHGVFALVSSCRRGVSVHHLELIQADVKLCSSLASFLFHFDEEMFFDEVAFGVAFDVCFQYAGCDFQVVICDPTRRSNV